MDRKHLARLGLCTLGLAVAISSSAHAVLLTDFTLYSMERLKIGGGSSSVGLVGSATHVQVDGASTVNGTIVSGDSFQAANSVTVTGTITNPGAFTTGSNFNNPGGRIVAMPDLPTLPAATVFSSGGAHYTLNGTATGNSLGNSVTLTLAPGSYGVVRVGGTSTLNLSSGDYYFDKIWTTNSPTLNLDLSGGAINIYVTDQVLFGNNVKVNLVNGGSPSDVYMEVHALGTAFNAAGGSDWIGTVYAPYGSIAFGAGSGTGLVQGAFYAGGEIEVKHGISFDYTPPPPVIVESPDVAVPEPATALLGVMGLAGALAMSRRRGVTHPRRA
jgi:hypothetical protein